MAPSAYATSEPNEISSKMTYESDELIVRGRSLKREDIISQKM